MDSLAQDTTNLPETSNLENVKLSDDGLDEPIEYAGRDSMVFDVVNEQVHLYGDASVKYGELTLNADYIVFNWADNTVSAEYMTDSLGRKTGIPEFKEGEMGFKSEKMRYNFKTKKGIIYDVSTKQNDLYVLGAKAKFTAGDKDSLHQHDDYVYSQDAIFTTCNHPEPHYGIRSRKQKVIPGKTVVVGPSNLEIANVPTPLWLPFGFFPLKDQKSSGLIFPQDYEYSPEWGYGLRNVGWYFPINDHFDLELSSDLYVRGTWRARALAGYKKRYKYSGNANLEFANLRRELEDASVVYDRSIGIRWSHRQDTKAHPTNQFGGNINLQTNDNQSRNRNNAGAVLTNELSSNLSFSKTFPGKPFRFTAGFNHSQNTNTRRVTINFPTLDFQMQEIYPFKKKDRIGEQKWFEKIGLRYTMNAKNKFETTDTTLFTQQTLDDAQFGVKHDINLNTSFRILKYINVTPFAKYTETWYWKTENRTFNDELLIEMDTMINPLDSTLSITSDTTFGFVDRNTEFGFKPLRQFDTGISANTQIFGTLLFKKGWLRGIRHVMKPNVGFSFTPDYTNPDFKYFQLVSSDSRPEFDDPVLYNIFENGIYGRPSNGGKQMAVTYGISNQLEAKVYSRRDSTMKKIKLFRSFNINGSYNFARDSLQWSDVSMGGTTDLVKGISTLNLRGVMTPYRLNEQNENVLLWKEDKKLLNLTSASATIRTTLNANNIKKLFKSDKNQSDQKEDTQKDRDKDLREITFLDVFSNMGLSHNIVFNLSELESGKDTFRIQTNSVSLRGEIPLTDKWKLQVGNIGYDFNSKSITYPDLGFYRDLHCWEMGANWQPSRGTYMFFIRVKPGTPLGFLDLPYQKNNADAFGGF